MADKYISAEQAYDYIRSILYETATYNVGINDDFASACEEIADNRLKIWLDDIPAADVVERKKGRWVRDEFGSKCPCCGSYAYRDKFGEPWESDFCPNCGADMRGENTDADR